ncbi:hypothetical protein [Leptolyngbya sp. 7M]|uniref:hypothetical protein n=1 Tax=Leptolyngbya sp. 7M TaxID=2812896 RepID=UPI001B8AFD01|nr:hypothetical protein [Leptolyngbya sp. 7M]QYO62307.1 hypothetical protein JVX88_19640 [Leptolyngbya sp. 7M]
MVQKSAQFNSLTSILASGLLLGSCLASKADGQVTDSELRIMPATIHFVVQSTTYPTIEAEVWLNPLAEMPINTPVYIRNGTDTQYLAVLSRDTLNPPPQTIEVTTRQRTLVTQWSRNELRAYAYEAQRNGSTLIIDPDPVNQGLFPISRVTRTCGGAFCNVTVDPTVVHSTSRTPRLVPDSSGVMRQEYEENHRIQVFVGSEVFTLVGWEGVFPIDTALATALQQASATIKVVTPNGWEASVNQGAVESLRTLYR